ncbi:MAG: GNAT family N-acetyltransferase [Planctomycetes bacterium]|nr:GNAT family N-acetyltransferase [Planctomycetota bacterium]
MAADPIARPSHPRLLRLDPLTPDRLHVISSWVCTEADAYFLAPRTPPPITPEQIRSWAAPGHQQNVLAEVGCDGIVGYGEVNELNVARGEYWLGHLIVDPARRGEGLGVQLTRMLARRAFDRFLARAVSLVVFPENRPAVECYKRAGFEPEGYETHDLPPYRKQARLLRMVCRAS